VSRRAILSVYDKTGVIELGVGLNNLGFELLASGGTAGILETGGLRVTRIEDVTGYPEMLGGRVKTLHPAVHAGILAQRIPEHQAELIRHGIVPVDVVVCNLYPFADAIGRPGVTGAEAIEEIDIGGVTLLRAAAKNFESVTVLCDPADYKQALSGLRSDDWTIEHRRSLALKAFRLTALYDATIAGWLGENAKGAAQEVAAELPATLAVVARRVQVLRYGENPHQPGAFYEFGDTPSAFEQIQGKELSYNNLIDLEAAWAMPQEFARPAVAIIKHTNPSGLAEAEDLVEAYHRALECDPVSAFGGIIAVNRQATRSLVTEIGGLFVEVLAAPSYTPEALEWLAEHKKNCRVMIARPGRPGAFVLRSAAGGLLVQTPDTVGVDEGKWQVVTKRQPSEDERRSMSFAWLAAKHTKSNAIVLVRGTATVGVGAGQMNRVDSVGLAVRRAGDRATGSILGSDAFFPFPDGIETAGAAGVTAIIQPGGSVRDEECIAAADRWGLAMVFTGERHFRH
jgi:phosphoribosylaminoimidazolecarboxamide formyltransferase / IMP cyclohydrolase